MPDKEVEILLVEDNPHDAEMTLRAFRKANLANRVQHARDGAEALEFIFGSGDDAGERIHLRPRVILLDIKLPKVDGIEVLRALKSDERTRLIPVVMLTSSKEERDVVESYRLGANSYIVKPVGFEKFASVVTELGLYWAIVNEPPA
jgi:CheY-like chemotaxis protein